MIFFNVSGINGVHRHPPDMHQQQSDKKRRNYKLIVDPTIHSYKGNQKVYRFDGINEVRIRQEHTVMLCSVSWCPLRRIRPEMISEV